jgi:3-hydroxyacyl-CoA dehydrogenase
MALYASIGKKPIQARAELGHVANRCKRSMEKCLTLIEQGVLSVDDRDAAVSYGPGLRWGVMGQSPQWHSAAAKAVSSTVRDHLMGPLAGMVKVLGTPNIAPHLKQTIIEGVVHEAAGRAVAQLAKKENADQRPPASAARCLPGMT